MHAKRLALIALSLAALGTVVAAAPARAQSRDPVADAQALFDSRQSASTTASMLKRDHARTVDQTTTILRTVGFAATNIVAALRTTYAASASAIYDALKRSGLDARTVSDAFGANGITLDCFDIQGTPVPCGGFGGTPDAAVTGQVSWNPQAQGNTGDKLYVQASNLPPVFVRIGSVTLTEESASASSVVVRLPSAPITGDLKLIRKSDGVVGLLQKDYRVVTAPLPWASYAAAASAGAILDMKQWMGGARIASGCTVNAPFATAAVGSFSSATGLAGAVKAKLLAAGASTTLADAWDSAFRTAFLNYTSLVTIPSLPIFPGLVMVNAPQAAPVSATAVPMAGLVSLGAISMQPATLSAAVSAAISSASPNDAERAAAVSSFANTVGGRFNLMLAKSLLHNLTGGGPVPSYNPPSAPAGAVTGGTCTGTSVVLVPPDVW